MVGPAQGEVLHTLLIADKYLVGCAFPTSHHPTRKKGRVQLSHPFYPKWIGFTSSENRLGSVSLHPSQPAHWRFLGMGGSEEQWGTGITDLSMVQDNFPVVPGLRAQDFLVHEGANILNHTWVTTLSPARKKDSHLHVSQHWEFKH